LLIIVNLLPQNWLPQQHPLKHRKNNFRSFIYGQSSTSPANFVKIGQVDVEIIGVTEITKIFLNKISAKHKPCSPALHAEWVG